MAAKLGMHQGWGYITFKAWICFFKHYLHVYIHITIKDCVNSNMCVIRMLRGSLEKIIAIVSIKTKKLPNFWEGIKNKDYTIQNMFKQPPPNFGKFKQIRPEHYADLEKVLLLSLPRSRRILSTLQLAMQGKEKVAVKFLNDLLTLDFNYASL